MDVITLSLAKKYANKVAAGYSNVRVDGMNLIFTLNDGSEVTMAIPAPADGKDGISVQNLSIDKDGSLLCHMSDGSVIDAGKVPMTEVELTDYYTKEETDTLLEGSGLKTFIWDGLSSEENVNNLTFFEEFYADFVASQGKTRLLVTTPNAQNPTYMNAEVGIEEWRTDVYLNISTYPSWWSSVEDDSEEYNLSLSTAYVTIENGKCVEVSELQDYDAELHFLSTTRQYDSGDYYTPISDGNPVSKGYMVETLKEGKYSISPDQLEEEFQSLITEPIITIDENDPTEIEFVRYEGEADGEYEFVYEDKWWGDGYRSTNGAHDNSYALGKFVLNNPGDKTVRVSIDYDLTCATGDTAVFSELDTELVANSWDDHTNAYKVITGETYTYGSIAYDLTPGEHFITFKYMVGWKDEGEGEGDSLMVSFGWTNGAVQEHQLATEQFVKDYVAVNGGGSGNGEGVNLSNYYTKTETNTAITNATENLMDEDEVRDMVEMYLSTLNTKGYTPITSNVDMGTLPSGIYMNTSGNWLDVKIAKAGKTTLSVKPGGYVFWSNALLEVTASAYSFIWTINWDGVSTGVFECARIQPSSDNTSHVYATGILLDLSKIVTQQYVDDSIANIDIPEADLTNYYTKEEVDGKVSAMRTPKSHDGEGMIGWYGTAVAGDNLTEAYGVTPDIIRAVNAGDYISWPSRVQTGAIENTICLYQMSYEVYNKDEGDYLEAIDIKIGKSPDVTYTYIIVGDNVYKETF